MCRVAESPAPRRQYFVPFFNPGSNQDIRSLLRIAGLTSQYGALVRIQGWDSRGNPGEAPVEFLLAPGNAVLLSAQQLEVGDPEMFTGRLGDGEGKWRLVVDVGHSGRHQVMSLLSTHTGYLSNVSRPKIPVFDSSEPIAVPLVPGANAAGIEGFVRIRNLTDMDGEVAVHAIDDTGKHFGPVTFEIGRGAYERLQFSRPRERQPGARSRRRGRGRDAELAP